MNSVLLEDFIIKNRGARIPRNPQLIFGDTNKYLRGDILDANAVVSEIASQVGDLVDTTPETLNTLRELAESLQETGGDINALVSRITDVETSVADLTQSQSTTIAELTSGLAADIAALQTGKVDAVSGKKLSTEDYTTAEKNKLAGIEAGALVNPTNVSAFTNDAGYLTAHQSLVGYATEVWVSNQGFLTEHQDISNKANIADLATVATSGSYNDLTNKPDFDSMLNNAGFVTQADFNDAIGIDTEGLQLLKAILSDDDTTTGLLNVLDQKVDKDDMLETVTETVTETVSTEDANGHEYVEIGGIKWATMNVGASSETDYGNYYQYGKGAAQYAATSGDSNYSGTEDPLDSSVDTAAQVWGGTWRMPTKAEFESLIANTNYTWETNFNNSGVNGGKFTDKTDSSKYVFFAAAGDYSSESLVGDRISSYLWSSTPDGNNAYYVLFYNGVTEIRSDSRRYGNSVRGVLDSVTTTVETTVEHKVDKYVTKNYLEGKEVNNNGHAYVDLGLPSGTLWATMNVGASDEIEVGNYYMHGYGSSTFEPWTLTSPANGAVLTSATDTATCVWGGDWITPGTLQFAELLANTTYLWMSDFNGVAGTKYTAKNGTGNYIFIPAGGFLVLSGATAVNAVSTNMVWSMTSIAGTLFISLPDYTPSTATNSTGYGYNVRPVICAAYAKKYDVTNAISGLHRVATTGSYTDLINKPSIPGAQIQSDWNLTNTGSKDYIKNKPDVLVKDDISVILNAIATNMGGDWHIPTISQFNELFTKPSIVKDLNTQRVTITLGNAELIFSIGDTYWTSTVDYDRDNLPVYREYIKIVNKSTNPLYSAYSSTNIASSTELRKMLLVLDQGGNSNGKPTLDFGLPSGTLWSVSNWYETESDEFLWDGRCREIKYVTHDKLTAISGQSKQTYIPRTVEDGQSSLISDATNIQDALNKLDDAIIDLLKWVEYEVTIPVAFYRIDTNNPNYAGLVNTNGNVIIVTDGTSSKQFIVNVNDNTWIMADATELELPLHLRTTFGVQEYNGTIENNHVEFEIDGTSFIYNDGTLTPSVTEWQDS